MMTTEVQTPVPSWGRSKDLVPVGDEAIGVNEFQLADRLAILDALGRYSWAYDERQVVALGNSFTEDAVWEGSVAGEFAIEPLRGREAISPPLQDHMANQQDQRRHNITNHVFAAQDRESAQVIAYLLLTSASTGQVKVVTTGFYRVNLIKDASGTWLISHMFGGFDTPF
jgi:ketosteroid isomerase-like protein